MEFSNKTMQYASKSLRDIFGDILITLGEKYQNIVVLDADLSSSTRTSNFQKIFPDRFFNMGIAEQNMMGTAIGLANSGKFPIVSGFSCFTIGRAWEFIRAAAYDNLPILICSSHSGLSADRDGGSHQSIEDISLISAIPNTQILCPADPIELKYILENEVKNIQNNKNPRVTYIRLIRSPLPWVFDKENSNYTTNYKYPRLISESSEMDVDVTIITTGSMTCFTPKIISLIEKEKEEISYRVVHCCRVKPLDEQEILNYVKKSKRIVTIEEHNITAGFGSIIGRVISEKFPRPMLSIGINDRFGQSGSLSELYIEYGLNPANIAKKILKFIK